MPTLRSDPAASGPAPSRDAQFPDVYDELRRLAEVRLREGAGTPTLSATGLVHEAYLRLGGSHVWNDADHLTAVAVRAMRFVLTDRARARVAVKRGGPGRPASLDAVEEPADEATVAAEDVLSVDAALTQLAQRDARLARLVELRFFGGMSTAEVADVLGTSARTVARDWVRAKALLRHLLD